MPRLTKPSPGRSRPCARFSAKHVELIALDAAPIPAPERKLTVDELLASRIKLPPGIGPLSLEDMERAIAEGALGR